MAKSERNISIEYNSTGGPITLEVTC